MAELVSGLMVTRPGRARRAVAAVADFAAQTYPARQLVIVSDEPVDPAVADVAGADTVIAVFPGLGFAALLGRALALAEGTVVVRWDDDDRNHPQRLARQLEAAAAPGAIGAALHDQLYLDDAARTLRWVDWRIGPPNGAGGVAAATLLWRRDAVKPVALAVAPDAFQAVTRAGRVAGLGDHGWLMAKGIHYGNVTGRDRLMAGADRRSLSAAALVRARGALSRELPRYAWQRGVSEFVVHAAGGSEAYTVEV